MTAAVPLQLLVVCTANRCRSPLAEALARRHLAARRTAAVVASAGTRAELGAPALTDTVAVAAELGLDLAAHRSRPFDAALVEWANLIVTMERAHVVDATTVWGAPLERTFTLPELAGLAGATPRRHDQGLDEWLAAIGAGRSPHALLGGPDAPGEVPDPIGRPRRVHRDTAAALDAMLATVVDAIVDPARVEG